MLTALIFLLILMVLVIIHEAGHFFVAKKLGIKVEEFGFGFPPRIFGIKKGETLYSLNWLPIGGFVKLYGEDAAGGGKVGKPDGKITKDLSRAFFARPAWQRALVVVFGVVMNFILAVVIISYLYGVSGVWVPGDKVNVSGIAPSSPAQEAGLVDGDIITSVNGIAITSGDQLIDYTKKHLGEELSLVIDRKGKTQHVSLIPRKKYPSGQGPMGVSIGVEAVLKKYPWYQAPVVGTIEAAKDSWMIASSLGMAIFQLVTKAQVPAGVAGPIGIAQFTGQVAQTGVLNVLKLVSLLSLNLAVLNILPIPALDGGRLFFILIELITRKKINQKYENYVHAAGMVVVLTLIVLITLHDIMRLISGQSLLPK